jgi:hypothetical protein
VFISFNIAFKVIYFIRFKILKKHKEDVKDDNRAILACYLLFA